ncbi:hypothetical protein PAPYR_6960 [Paratrimastix pyriformis]|uniref:IPT/TIG domain-containing protein n=1 Tax=Paratrimastix pyriformis TaxID=342808 RepID=A0ABQ8UJN0_9EUKA|nr:hypothetical protein PAPYR_6960 [Paratrimastix pyriformis]
MIQLLGINLFCVFAFFIPTLCQSGDALWAVGASSSGQLGLGSTIATSPLKEVSLPVGCHVADMFADPNKASSFLHCEDGRLFATGDNTNGKLCRGSTTGRASFTEVSLPAGKTLQSVRCGASHTILWMTDGRLPFVWFGTASQASVSPTAVTPPAGLTVAQVGTGLPHSVDLTDVPGVQDSSTVLLMTNGEIYGMGSNRYGRLGLDSSTTSVTVWTLVPQPAGHTPPSVIGVSSQNLAVIYTDGAMATCGFAGYHQNWDGSLDSKYSLGIVNAGRQAAELYMGTFLTMQSPANITIAISITTSIVAADLPSNTNGEVFQPTATDKFRSFTEATVLASRLKVLGALPFVHSGFAWGLPNDCCCLCDFWAASGAPTVTSVTPSTVASGEAARLALTGTRFRAGATVTVGGLPCTDITIASTTSLQCTLDASLGDGAHDVAVNNTDIGLTGTKTGAVTVSLPLAVSSINATVGWPGDELTLAGTFPVPCGSVPATIAPPPSLRGPRCPRFTGTTRAHVLCGLLPPGCDWGHRHPPPGELLLGDQHPVRGARPAQRQHGHLHDLRGHRIEPRGAVPSSGVTFSYAPTLSGLSVTHGPATSAVSVTGTGTNFLTGAKVRIGTGAAHLDLAATMVTLTRLRFTMPTQLNAGTQLGAAHSGQWAVAVLNPASAGSGLSRETAASLTYAYDPVVTGVGPASVTRRAITSTMVTGRNFYSGATVRLVVASGESGTAPADITPNGITSEASLYFTMPAQEDGMAEAYEVHVISGGVVSTQTNAIIRYKLGVTSVSPASGAPGDLVNVTGRDFTSGCRSVSPEHNLNPVRLGAAGTLVGASFLSATSLQFAVPAQPSPGTSSYEVVVNDPATGSQSAPSGVIFSYARLSAPGVPLPPALQSASSYRPPASPAPATCLTGQQVIPTATCSPRSGKGNSATSGPQPIPLALRHLPPPSLCPLPNSDDSLALSPPRAARRPARGDRDGHQLRQRGPGRAGRGAALITVPATVASPSSLTFAMPAQADAEAQLGATHSGQWAVAVLNPASAAVVTGVSPTSAARGAATSVTVTGRNFYSGAAVRLVAASGESGTAPADITPNGIAPGEASLTFTMPAQADGMAEAFEVHVSHPAAAGVFSAQTNATVQYVTLPTVVSAHAATSNAHSPLARVGDQVTATFTACVALDQSPANRPAVTLAGRPAAVGFVGTGGGRVFTASLVMAAGDPQGNLTYALSGMRDLAGNPQPQATIAGTLEALFDSVAPGLVTVGISSTRPGDQALATVGDRVVVTLEADEPLDAAALPAVTIAGRSATVVGLQSADGRTVAASQTMQGGDPLGNVTFALSGSLCDPAGNCGPSLAASGGTSGIVFALPPAIQSVTPALRPHTAAEVLLAVCGVRFEGPPTVRVGGQPCAQVLANASCLVCRSPGGLPDGRYATVEVVNANGLAANQSGLLWYQGAVTVASVSPPSASQAAGTQVAVTLAGTGFVSAAAGAAGPCPTVTVGGLPCPVASCPSATSLTCALTVGPAGAPNGPAAVTVSNPAPDGATGALPGGFAFQGPAPVLTGLTPASGPLAGGQTVGLRGTGLRAAGATVRVGGRECTGLAADPAAAATAGLTCTVPAGAALGPCDVVLTQRDGTGATLAEGCTTPAGLADSTALVLVANRDHTNATATFAYYGTGLAPVISRLTPSSSPWSASSAILATGANFRPGLRLTIGGLTCANPTVTSSRIRCTLPAPGAGHYGPADVMVANADGTSGLLAGGYTFTGTAPVVTGLSPSSVSLTATAAATATARATANPLRIVTLTVTGRHFQPGAAVALGSRSCAEAVVDPTGGQITCVLTLDPGAVSPGPAGILVTNPDGLTSAPNDGSASQAGETAPVLYFQGAAPTLAGLNPSGGPCNLGTPVVLQGTGLRPGGVGGQRCLNATTLTTEGGGGSLSCVVPPAPAALAAQLAESPANASAPVDVRVRNSDMTEATLGQAFAYTAPVFRGGPALAATAVALISVGAVIGGLLCLGLLLACVLLRRPGGRPSSDAPAVTGQI